MKWNALPWKDLPDFEEGEDLYGSQICELYLGNNMTVIVHRWADGDIWVELEEKRNNVWSKCIEKRVDVPLFEAHCLVLGYIEKYKLLDPQPEFEP